MRRHLAYVQALKSTRLIIGSEHVAIVALLEKECAKMMNKSTENDEMLNSVKEKVDAFRQTISCDKKKSALKTAHTMMLLRLNLNLALPGDPDGAQLVEELNIIALQGTLLKTAKTHLQEAVKSIKVGPIREYLSSLVTCASKHLLKSYQGYTQHVLRTVVHTLVQRLQALRELP
jgi:hypothetical protein